MPTVYIGGHLLYVDLILKIVNLISENCLFNLKAIQ